MRTRHTTIVLLSLAGLAGCHENLFLVEDGDHGYRVRPEQLRGVESSSITKYIKPAPAPDPGATPKAAVFDENLARSRFDNLERTELTLEQCRTSALTNNLDLKVAVVDPTIARQSVSREEAAFESVFTLNARYSDLDQPTASELLASQSKTLTVDPGVRIPLLSGGTATVELPMSKSDTNNSFSTLNPAYSSDLQFSISQPLLRNAGRRATTAALRIASYQAQAAMARTKLEVIRQLAAVDRAYWRLYQARKSLEVRQQKYELAVEQLRRAERRVRAQLAAEIEVIRAQAGVADSLDAIIQDQNSVLNQQRELKRIINTPGLTLETKTLVIPSSPPDPVEYQFDQKELMAQAITARSEMIELELKLAADAAQIAFNKNQALPLFVLDYVYRVNGLGGSTQDSARSLERNHYEDWELGLRGEIPLGNEAAKSRVREALLTRLQRLASKDAKELSIRQEVLNAIDQINASWQRILASRQSVILNTRALQAEQRQFDVGSSTSTNVLDAATKLADARLAELQAVTDYQIAQVDLAFATGTLLGSSKVSFEPAAEPSSDEPAPAEDLPPSLSATPATPASAQATSAPAP